MLKRYKPVFVIPFLLAFFLLVVSGPSLAQDVPSEEMIRKKLSKDTRIRTMGVQRQPRPTPSGEQGEGLIDLPIPFPKNQYLISPDAVPFLQALGNALAHKDLRGNVFEIQGHTCDLGSDEYNLGLSQKRAIAVKEYLVGYFRLSPAQIRSVGYGERKPVVDNSTEDGRTRNRRVTVVNTFQPFSEKEIRLSVTSRVKYLRGRETIELESGQTLTARDDYSVSFNANEQCHVYIFQIGADSEVFQLFPNPAYHEGTNPVEAGRQYRVPGRPDLWLGLDENKGDEEIVILASPGAMNEADKVCKRILEGPTALAQKPKDAGGKQVRTMGVKGTRISKNHAEKKLPKTSALVVPAGLFTWRFPFRHQ